MNKILKLALMTNMFGGGAAAPNPLLTGLVSYWKLNEYSDGSAPVTRVDSHGTNHLADNGNTKSMAGDPDGAALFEGTQWLSIEDNASLSTGDIDFTIDFWTRATLFTNILIAKLTNSGAGEYQIPMSDPGKVGIELWRSVAQVGIVESAQILNLDTAFQYVQVYHDSVRNKVGVIVNGGAATEVDTTNSPADTAVSFTIGCRGAGNSAYQGRIKKVGFWKRLLTPAETVLRAAGNDYPFDLAGVDIVLQSPSAFRVYQRDGSNQGAITIVGNIVKGTGTYDIDACWNGGSWASIDTAVSADFSGSLTAQAAGQGTFQVRAKTAGTETVIVSKSVSYVGIGDVFAVAGQSNAVGYGDNNQGYSHATLKAGLFGNDYRWKELVDPTDSIANQVDAVSNDGVENAKGSVWPLLATSIMAKTGYPVAFVPCALGGSAIADWQPNANHVLRTTLYGSMNFRASLTGCKAVLFHQGEQDVSLGTTQANYNAGLDGLANAVNTDRGAIVLAAKIHNISGDETPIYAAIDEAIGNNANVKLGADNTGVSLSPNGLHFTTDAQLAALAARWQAALEAAFGW